MSHLVPLDGHFVIQETGTESRSHTPVCVFKGTASHNRVSACAHIAADGSIAGSVHVCTLLQMAPLLQLKCWAGRMAVSWVTHKAGSSGHASLEVTQKLIQLRRGERILSAGWEPLKELSISVILSDCASGRSPWWCEKWIRKEKEWKQGTLRRLLGMPLEESWYLGKERVEEIERTDIF